MTKTFTLISAGAIALLMTTAGCAEHLADCVEVYPNTGATRRAGYTKAACEEHCASLQGLLDCYWDGRLGLVTEPSVVVSQGDKERATQISGNAPRSGPLPHQAGHASPG